jgi:hypothetical protein
MLEWSNLGKMLILFGGIAILIGLVLLFVDKIPFIGKLPGDIYIERRNFTFYFPLMTSILISIIITIILNLLSRR